MRVDVAAPDLPDGHRLAPLMTAAAERLRSARQVVVTGHIDPDGDALGSLLAVTAGLRQLGIEASAAWGARHQGGQPAPVPVAWRPLLPALDRLVTEPADLPGAIDVLVCCDTATADRLGTLAPLVDRAATTIVIDHHAVGDPFGQMRLVSDSASSTGVIALALLDRLRVVLTPPIATALFLAILTDTGRFAYPATSSADLRAAARLMDAGADHAGVARAVYEHTSPGFVKLLSRVLHRAQIDEGMVLSWATQADLDETGAAWEETDGLIGPLRAVRDRDLTCLLRESDHRRWRTSLRSRGATDVAAVAERFGGGGHRMAAGLTAEGDIVDVVAQIRSAVRELRA